MDQAEQPRAAVPEAPVPEQDPVEAKEVAAEQKEKEPSAGGEDGSEAASQEAAPEERKAEKAQPAAEQAPLAAEKDPELLKVERLLEDNVWSIFLRLTGNTREVFRKRGELLATSLFTDYKKRSVAGPDVFKAINSWLKLVPRINPHFANKASLIKASRYLEMHAKQHGDASLTIE